MVNCQNIFFSNENMYILFFFGNSDRDFYSENNNASQVYTYITKIQKKSVKKRHYRLCPPFCSKYWRHLCAIPMLLHRYLLFIFPVTLIWLLHCHAMHFDSFSLGARHLFQKLVFFLRCYTCDTYIVVFRIKISIRISKKSMCSHLNFFFFTV
jgi:hypothetical protein